jgi:hypothetical protein
MYVTRAIIQQDTRFWKHTAIMIMCRHVIWLYHWDNTRSQWSNPLSTWRRFRELWYHKTCRFVNDDHIATRSCSKRMPSVNASIKTEVRPRRRVRDATPYVDSNDSLNSLIVPDVFEQTTGAIEFLLRNSGPAPDRIDTMHAWSVGHTSDTKLSEHLIEAVRKYRPKWLFVRRHRSQCRNRDVGFYIEMHDRNYLIRTWMQSFPTFWLLAVYVCL